MIEDKIFVQGADRMAKVVFFDIDGTIYEFKRGIMPSAIDAVRKLKENGHIPVICTGRTKSMIFQNIVDMGFDSIISGGGTYAEYNGKPIYLEEMDNNIAKDIIISMRQNGFVPIPEGHEYMYIDREDVNGSYGNIYKIYEKHIGDRIKPIDFETMKISKISAAFTENSNWDGVYEKFKDDFIFVNHNNILMELIPNNFSKSVGIERFLKYTGIDRKDTIAFGDSFNDLEMLQYVEHGVAMGNSDPKLFELVKYKTESIEKDGVANELKRLGLI